MNTTIGFEENKSFLSFQTTNIFLPCNPHSAFSGTRRIWQHVLQKNVNFAFVSGKGYEFLLN